MTWIQLIPDHIQRTMGADELTGEVGQVGQEICDGTLLDSQTGSVQFL